MNPSFLLATPSKRIAHWISATVFIACFAAAQLHAQGTAQLPFEPLLSKWRQANYQEKLYVHTDKAAYITGEICWFKIYIVDASYHQFADFGKVAYVEILDAANRPVLQAKIPLAKGTGDGSFFLPATVGSGNYRLRAYTNWMKNYGADYFFEKKITIINVQKAAAEQNAVAKPLYDIGFFPEGGNLVAGTENKVGFKVNNQYGKGVDFTGVLVSDKGDTLLSFSPHKFGMGNFIFSPAAGVQYKAVLNLPGGEKQTKPLPLASAEGFAMQLKHGAAGQLEVTVKAGAGAGNTAVYLFVHTRNITKAAATGSLKNGQATFNFSDTALGEGISQLTVFNSTMQPVCERLYFKKPQASLAIKAQPDQAVYSLRKPINIAVNTNLPAGQSAAANMSMAVYKVDSITTGEDISITDYLVLSADLTGSIESPAYYLTGNDDEAADNLMLTQGWRKFSWSAVLQSQKPSIQYLPEIYGHIIRGKLTAMSPGLKVRNIVTYLTVPGIKTQFQPAITDEAGNFKFDMKDLYSDGDIIVQTNNQMDTGYRIEIEQPFLDKYSAKPLAAYSYNPAVQNNALAKRYSAAQVQNTYLLNKLNQPVNLDIDTTAFYIKPDATYLLDNYVRFTTLEEVFREYVMEVNVRKRDGKFVLPVADEVNKKPFETPPLILLDGLPIFDADKLMTYDPLKIRKLEVMGRKYFLRDNSFDGIINLTTYKGDLEGFEIDPRAVIINYEGLQLQREFYSPIYATEQQQQSRLPDYRSLLFWTPNLSTGATGNAQAKFYSADVPGKYVAVIQGITADGKMGEEKVYFEVK